MKNEEEVEVYKLVLQLRHEKLLIRNEKHRIQELNKLITSKTHEIIRNSWITTKQRVLLYQRESISRNYKKVHSLLNTEFVDAKQALGFQNAIKIGNLLQVLRSQPTLLAKWLIAGEQLAEDSQNYLLLLENLVVGLYGCFIFPEDAKFMLALLYELAKIQLLNCDDPRKIIKQRTCSFKHLYFLFHEVLQSAKFFLSASMEVPIIQMMSCTDYNLDVDPEKTAMRFRQDENEVASLFQDVEEYRRNVVAKLVEFTNNFITSLLENVYGFPKSIAWIVNQIAKIIEKSFSTKQANAIINELIFTLYVCPVIVDPEQYGICTSQVTDIGRHNLIQVCQIIQSLALSRYEPIDPRFSDVFDLLDKTMMNSFIELLFFDMDTEEPPIETSPTITRDIMLFTEHELNNLVSFLHKTQMKCNHNDNFTKDAAIEELLSSLSISSNDNSPKSSRLLNNDEHTLKISNFFSSATKNHVIPTTMETTDHNTNIVLIFPIDQVDSEPVGLVSEKKIIESIPLKSEEIFQASPEKVVTTMMPDTPPQNGGELLKQSFTFPDEGSIGNTSDNLEAISEAASNHSVDSSIELENEDQNDNLSDMVSANVSGRGTPNISGRDTPSSQVCENDDRVLVEQRQADIAQPQPKLNRQIRSEIDDKFCKFEIKKLLEGDETISIISETWSTDVLSSDNETVDATEPRPTIQLVEAVQEVAPNILDLSETQSESAWSTDVMTSDTERLTEVDNEDAVSVAQSDDTRSETDDICGGGGGVRRLSSSSNSFVSVPGNQNYVTSSSVVVVVVHNNMSYLPSDTPTTATNTTKFVNSSKFQEYGKVDIKNDRVSGKIYRREQTGGNANRVFKSSTIEHSRSLIETSEAKTVVYKTSGVKNGVLCKDVELNNVAGPSRTVENDKNHRPNEILLSNCSLNSSSSGSSSHSFENKNSSDQWESKQWLNSSGSSLNVTLTPSESTSELSVLSGSKKTVVNRIIKPSASTGAIPKSISFDMSADKGLEEESRSKRGGFFGKLRMGFRNRRGKSFRNQDDFRLENDELLGVKRQSEVMGKSTDVSDDILAKYRTKPFVDNVSTKDNCDLRKSSKESSVYSSDSEEINSFNDIKNKLRLVLSNTSEIPHYVKNNPISIRNKVEMILRLELGKARRLREWSHVARISEAIRCINLTTDDVCNKLIRSMREDLILRSTYIQYLVTSKQELLFCDSYLNCVQDQITHDKQHCEKYLVTVCVKEFLLEQEAVVLEFCEEFKQLSLADEKCDFLQKFYSKLYFIMKGSAIWRDIVCKREKSLRITLERYIMTKIYKNSIYPNGDGDRDRDRVLQNHIEKLSKIITPNHKDLLIEKMYLRECPWLPAQDALRVLNIYKTPRDKVKCVVNCAKCLMDLLALSQSSGSATADDFMPVLVYVIIKVNPEALLSTVQYVNSFFHNQLFGEEEYWWTQFCAAVEYIKTMDYSD